MPSKTIIELNGVSKSRGSQLILKNIDLEIKDGEFLTLVGPSGCGKTTLLRLLAGFEHPTSGAIWINGESALNMPAQARHINTVFQSYALFPHMNVFENVAFGLRCEGISDRDIKPRVLDMLRMVRLSGYEDRYPKALSGGQQQRVAIARAAVKQPVVLLLDEPLSSLDYRLRKNMQIELKQLQRNLGITFVFVTHDQEEALSMSDTVVVMQQGRIVQQGTPREIYEDPKNSFVASFIGESNLWEIFIQEISRQGLHVMLQGILYKLKDTKKFKPGDRACLLIRPEDVRVYHHTEIKNSDKKIPAVVEAIIYKGMTIELILKLSDGKLISASEFFHEDNGERLTYTIGEAVWVDWLPNAEIILPYDVSQ